MSTEVKLFENTQFGKIRVTMKDGDPWFIAKDVCECLALSNPSESLRGLDFDEKSDLSITEVSSNGTKQARNVNIISESGLYSLVLRSRKPEAKQFKRWVTHEVLPSIRKTGSYSVEPNLTRDQNDIILAAKHVFEIGLHDQNQVMLAVDKVFKKVYGVSALEIGKIELQAPQQCQLLTPTEIGVELEKIGGGKFSGKRVNKILETIGFQKRVADYWEATDSGKSYAVYLDTNKRHSDGTPIRQLKWTSEVIFYIKNLLGLGE